MIIIMIYIYIYIYTYIRKYIILHCIRHFGDNLARSPYVREVMDAFSSPVGRSRLMMIILYQ